MAVILNQTINASAIPLDAGTVFSNGQPLLLYIAGIVLYSLFIFKLYRFVAHRDILKLDLHTRYAGIEGFFARLQKMILYIVEHIILVPLVIFAWFSFLATALFLLGSNSAAQVMLISMALVGAIRVTSYFSEDLSRDLSKMLPFALLAVFMVDLSIVSFAHIGSKLSALIAYPDQLFSYLVFVVALELVMRMLFLIYNAFNKEDESEVKPPIQI